MFNGFNVMAIQSALSTAGIATGIDGIYGPQTTANVRIYQGRYGLTVDGIVGVQTWGHMSSLINAPATYSYAWYDCTTAVAAVVTTIPDGCTPIAGAAGPSYTLAAMDAAAFVTTQVTATNTAGAATKWTLSTAAVTP
jgi:peptidoglycan hydrolase-like protein with peptidoglycan-binding domain